jgi:hypothetical protein
MMGTRSERLVALGNRMLDRIHRDPIIHCNLEPVWVKYYAMRARGFYLAARRCG